MTVLARFASRTPIVCAVCRRRAVWLGYRPPESDRLPAIWLCDDEYCHAAAAGTYAMPKDIAGGYLDEIGKTDLANLDPEQWREFLRRLLTGYERVLRRKIINDEPALGGDDGPI